MPREVEWRVALTVDGEDRGNVTVTAVSAQSAMAEASKVWPVQDQPVPLGYRVTIERVT